MLEFYKYATSSFPVFMGCFWITIAIGYAANWTLCGIRGVRIKGDD